MTGPTTKILSTADLKSFKVNSKTFSTTKMAAAPMVKSFYCVFCRDIASLRMGDFGQFKGHMEEVHRVSYEYDILLAINFIERGEKDDIIEKVRRKVGGQEEEKVEAKTKPTSKFSKILIEKVPNEVNVKKENSDARNKMETLKPKAPPGPMKMNNGLQIIPIKLESPVVKSEAPKIVTINKVSEHYTETKLSKEFESCPKCGKKFSDKKKLRKHMQKKFSCERRCEKCGTEFSMAGELRAHQKMKKECVKQPYKCEDCPKEFLTLSLFKIHKSRRRTCKKQDLKCDNCLKWFSNSSSLKNHKEKREKPCQKVVTCEKCGKLLKESKYEKHLSANRCSAPMSMKCKNCLKTFKTKPSARTHYKRNESGEKVCLKRIRCDKCKRRMKEQDFEKHAQKNNCVLVDCERCGDTFTASQLKKHMMRKRMCNPQQGFAQAVQETEKIKCDICENTFDNLRTAKHHIKAVHNAEQFPCVGCDRIFTSEKYLIFHKKRNKNCPEFNPDLVYVAKTGFEAADKKPVLPADLKEEEGMAGLEEAGEAIACWGCDKQFHSLRYLEAHMQQKRDCPAFTQQEGKYVNGFN